MNEKNQNSDLNKQHIQKIEYYNNITQKYPSIDLEDIALFEKYANQHTYLRDDKYLLLGE